MAVQNIVFLLLEMTVVQNYYVEHCIERNYVVVTAFVFLVFCLDMYVYIIYIIL